MCSLLSTPSAGRAADTDTRPSGLGEEEPVGEGGAERCIRTNPTFTTCFSLYLDYMTIFLYNYSMPPTEADTCRTYVVPKLHAAGWDDEQIREQVTFTDGRIVPIGGKATRKKNQRADYILRYRRDYPIAVVEAKAGYRHPADGLPQAKAYAETLSLKFAYATNGRSIIEFDYLTGATNELDHFPSPDELWGRIHGPEELSMSSRK